VRSWRPLSLAGRRRDLGRSARLAAAPRRVALTPCGACARSARARTGRTT
jgi:hypothetical protein